MPRDIYHRTASINSETFRLFGGDSSLSNLSQSLTINSQAVDPTFFYEGKSATTSSWTATVGENLAIAGSGSDPTPNRDTPLTDITDEGVLFNNGKYYSASSGDWGTEDGVIELLFRASGTTNATMLFHNDGTNGYRVYVNASDQLVFEAAGSSSTVSVTSGALTANAWYYAALYYDASGSAQWYVNGVASGSAANVSGVGSLTASTNLLVGSSGTNHFDNIIAFSSLYLGASWLDTHLQSDVANERFTKITGFYPALFKETALPSVQQRNSIAILDKIIFGEATKFFSVGAYWPRFVQRRDSQSNRDLDFVHSNGFPYSEDLSKSSWSKTRLTVDNSAGVDFAGFNSYGLVADGTSASHYISTALTPPSSFKHIFSAYAKAGSKTWCYLKSNNTGGNDVYAYFDLSNIVTGTKHSEVLSSGIEDASDLLGTGWCRVWMTYDGGTLSHTHEVHAADGDNDINYQGDSSTVQIYVCGLQHDYSDPNTGAESPRGYIRTNGVGRTLGAKVKGYLAEEARTNQVPSTLVGTWSTSSCGVTAASGLGIDGLSAQRITDTAVSTFHGAYKSRTDTPAAGSAQQFTVMVKTETLTYACVEAQFGVSATAYSGGIINLLTGAVTPYSNGVNPSVTITVINKGNGWWNVNLSAIWDGVSGTNKAVAVGTSDGNRTYLGDGTGTILVQFPQAEQGSFATSMIDSGTASSATRVKDELRYVAGDNIGGENPTGLSIYAETLMPDLTSASASAVVIINDGGSSADRIRLARVATTQYARLLVDATGGNEGDCTSDVDIADGVAHQLYAVVKTNDANLYVDGALEASDTSVNIPDGLDRIDIGQNVSAGGQGSKVVSNIRIFKKALPNKNITASWE